MKGFLVSLLAISFLPATQAGSLNETTQHLTRAIQDQVTTSLWEGRCSRPEALRLHANCFVNPNGVALWEMAGPEREKWKPVAIQEKIRLQREYKKNVEVAKEKGKMTAHEYKLNQQMCDFWKQQTKSQKQQRKIAEHCGDGTNR
ncbi:hypothetical protein A8B84_20150 [Marinobacter sp. EhC06]|jgi:hypothetical protein|uniref:hypothetical protein n=1 Tax=unclassified Marinobacter TaxID=83889 RepID=UPI0007D9B4D0|nr:MULTISPECIES: hypothetical protein [unclassified Marinobacter]OAN92261.1 hypothetical protein A8B80_19335 [Marinobacter sp. EhN04]OAN93116.1 hypothetical protein A8B84_20150 [Marinobacter sp. EhC06]